MAEKSLPPKVSKENLRKHFQTTYGLAEEQIGILLDSTSKSLNTSLTALEQTLESDGELSEISRLGHSMKGLLLNMGESQWAEIAREIELGAAKGEKKDYRAMTSSLRWAVEDLLY